MLSQAKRIDTIPTESAMEAAILESELIKQQSPPYNVALKERGRRLWYCTEDYQAPRNEPDRPHLFGPFPNREIIDAIQGMGDLIRRDGPIILDKARCSQLLCMPLLQGPDVSAFNLGLDCFMQRHGSVFAEKSLSHAIATLGSQFWREHLARLAQQKLDKQRQLDEVGPASQEETELQSEEAPEEPFAWTPEVVCGALTGLVRSASLLFRRARWYLMLSESAIVWEEKQKAEPVERVLVFSSGKPVGSRPLHGNEAVHLPPGFRKRYWGRQKCFSIMTFDRMRVLTTEVRRLLSENRKVSLLLGQRTRLWSDDLARVLQWV